MEFLLLLLLSPSGYRMLHIYSSPPFLPTISQAATASHPVHCTLLLLVAAIACDVATWETWNLVTRKEIQHVRDFLLQPVKSIRACGVLLLLLYWSNADRPTDRLHAESNVTTKTTTTTTEIRPLALTTINMLLLALDTSFYYHFPAAFGLLECAR